MSQSLIIFKPSGNVVYNYNNKIHPFNEFISSLVNETITTISLNFTTKTINNRRFYCYTKDDVYISLYFDSITTIDNELIKQTLFGIYKTYTKLRENDEEKSDKLKKMVDLQFNNLMKLKQQQSTTIEEVSREATPISNVNSGTSTPNKKSKQQTHAATSKKMRKWDNGEMVENNDAGALDYSGNQADDGISNGVPREMKIDNSAFIKDHDLVLVNELNDILNESDDESDDGETNGLSESKGSGFFSKISSYLGGAINVDEVSKQFNDQLMSKNIAPATSKQIIDKIKNKLSNNKKVTMNMYKQALTDELTKILTPNVSTDLLHDIKRNAESNTRPYVISVVGVNGVGKSTNLAKLAYWFLQNNFNVLICACDTFRSGAVEQLKVHVNNLNRLNENSQNSKIDIFEKGYGSGDHVVQTAKQAIQYATDNRFDIVLIDTAGRTHSNAKLMAPLKKFGDAANPNKIIMVGEALVGTDSVEQAINFNNAFGNKRSLDFFIISKVDTVGDLVGTMINMVMATKVPILFVGTGQTYTDIKRLSVKQVVEMLMK